MGHFSRVSPASSFANEARVKGKAPVDESGAKGKAPLDESGARFTQPHPAHASSQGPASGRSSRGFMADVCRALTGRTTPTTGRQVVSKRKGWRKVALPPPPPLVARF
jgi:hypothetical protein